RVYSPWCRPTRACTKFQGGKNTTVRSPAPYRYQAIRQPSSHATRPWSRGAGLGISTLGHPPPMSAWSTEHDARRGYPPDRGESARGSGKPFPKKGGSRRPQGTFPHTGALGVLLLRSLLPEPQRTPT